MQEVLGVNPNPAQQRVAKVLDETGADGSWPMKEIVAVAANQIGKTLLEACIMLWGSLYKIGVDPRDQRGWANAPYLWVHLGPVQQQAYHAYKDAKLLIRGEHPAQGDRCRLPKGLIQETKIENYYDGFTFQTGAQIMFRTAEHKAEAVLGYRAAAISVDEAAFVDYLTEVKDTVLMMRLIASGGPLFMFSTPNGMNDFYDQASSIQSRGEEVGDMVWRDENRYLFWAVITDNLGYGLDQSEIDRMEANLNPATKEQQLRGAFLEPAEAFFVPQDKIITAFRQDLPHFEEAIAGHQYAIFFDPSVSSDPTAAIVLDCTSWPWRGVWMGHWVKPMGIESLMQQMFDTHALYHNRVDSNVLGGLTRAVLGYDSTSMGGAVVSQLLGNLSPKRPINFGGQATKKLNALANLRNRLTKGDLVLPYTWTQLRSEILNYRLDDKKIRQDLVMALVGADMVATSMMGTMSKPRPINPHARVTERRRLTW